MKQGFTIVEHLIVVAIAILAAITIFAYIGIPSSAQASAVAAGLRQVDKAIDDGNLTCGKVRYADQRIFYSLSYNQNVLN